MAVAGISTDPGISAELPPVAGLQSPWTSDGSAQGSCGRNSRELIPAAEAAAAVVDGLGESRLYKHASPALPIAWRASGCTMPEIQNWLMCRMILFLADAEAIVVERPT